MVTSKPLLSYTGLHLVPYIKREVNRLFLIHTVLSHDGHVSKEIVTCVSDGRNDRQMYYCLLLFVICPSVLSLIGLLVFFKLHVIFLCSISLLCLCHFLSALRWCSAAIFLWCARKNWTCGGEPHSRAWASYAPAPLIPGWLHCFKSYRLVVGFLTMIFALSIDTLNVQPH